MIATAKQWLRKNRPTFVLGFGVVGLGYVAGQYTISKIIEARERFASDQRAREKFASRQRGLRSIDVSCSIRRRFQQNQDDSTITVLELLPTIAEQVLAELPSEEIIEHLQRRRADRVDRNSTLSEIPPSDYSSTGLSVNEEESKSASSETFVRASQVTLSSSQGPERPPSKPTTKAQLWNELKITSITRALTLIYSVSLLSLFTRIQLNLLGRKSYSSSLVASAAYDQKGRTISLENREEEDSGDSSTDDYNINRKYLTFTWWFLNCGWKTLNAQIETAVKEVFGEVKPNESIPLGKLSSLIVEVRRRVEGTSSAKRSTRKWLPFLLPRKSEEAYVLRNSGISMGLTVPAEHSRDDETHSSPKYPLTDQVLVPPLQHLLDESADIIESPLFTHVLTLLLDAAFSHLVDQQIRSEAYKLEPLRSNSSLPSHNELESDVKEPTVKLATTLAILTKEAHRIGHNLPNDYVQALENVQDLEAFAAVIYSSNYEHIPGSGDDDDDDDDDDWVHDIGESHSALVSSDFRALPQNIVGKASSAVDAARSGLESFWTTLTT